MPPSGQAANRESPYMGLEAATKYGESLVAMGKRVFIRFRPERKVTWDFGKGQQPDAPDTAVMGPWLRER